MGTGPGSIGDSGSIPTSYGENSLSNNKNLSNKTSSSGRNRAIAVNVKDETMKKAIEEFKKSKGYQTGEKFTEPKENQINRTRSNGIVRSITPKTPNDRDKSLASLIVPPDRLVKQNNEKSEIPIGLRSTSQQGVFQKRDRHIKREVTPEPKTPRQLTNYNDELEIFKRAVIEKSHPYVHSEIYIKFDKLIKNNPNMNAEDLRLAKESLCHIAGVSFEEIHPTYAAMRNPAPVNQKYRLGVPSLRGISQKSIVASIKGVKNHEGKVYTSLDREAEGASNFHRRKVGNYTWYTAGVCAAYAHSTENVMQLKNRPPAEFTKKIQAFRKELLKDNRMSEAHANKIIENILGAKDSIIKNSDIEHLAGSDALLTSFVRVFDVLNGILNEIPNNGLNTENTENKGIKENKKILWQRIMAPDIVRAAISKGELNGDNERLMAHMEVAILDTFKEVELNGTKIDISYINTPINEKAKKAVTFDPVIDNAGSETKKRLLADLENQILKLNPETNPIRYRELKVLKALGEQEGRFAESVFVFVAAEKLGYNIMLGCKSGKDRTGFFSAIASSVLLEVDRLAQSEHFNEDVLSSKISKIISGDLNWGQWKKIVALTLPHMFDLPAFNQGLVGLKADNVLDSMWKCFNSQLIVQGNEVSDLKNSNRAKAYFLVMLLQGSGGVEGLLNWMPKDDPNSPFNDSEARSALEALNKLVDSDKGSGLLDIQDQALDKALSDHTSFSGKLAVLKGEKISKVWLNGATYAGI